MESTHKKLYDTSHSVKPRLSHLFNSPLRFKPSFSQMVDKKSKGIKCFKCQQPGHLAYNCLKKYLHIGLEHEEKPESQKDERNEKSFDYEIYDPVDLDDEEVDISLGSIVRRILKTPKVEKEDWRRTSIFQMLVWCKNQA